MLNGMMLCIISVHWLSAFHHRTFWTDCWRLAIHSWSRWFDSRRLPRHRLPRLEARRGWAKSWPWRPHLRSARVEFRRLSPDRGATRDASSWAARWGRLRLQRPRLWSASLSSTSSVMRGTGLWREREGLVET